MRTTAYLKVVMEVYGKQFTGLGPKDIQKIGKNTRCRLELLTSIQDNTFALFRNRFTNICENATGGHLIMFVILYCEIQHYIILCLRNRSFLAVNCCAIIHCLEVSCKEDQITSVKLSDLSLNN